MPTSGRAVVDASVRVDQQGHPYGEGFSFSSGRVITVPNPTNVNPDVLPLFKIGSQGEIEGFLLAQIEIVPAFYHVGSRATFEEAQVLFEQTICIPEDARFEDLGGIVSPNQVWAVRTIEGKFGKILIVDTFFCTESYDSAGITVEQLYGDITFDWQYQPDGTRCFE